jgi:hypothetical protein
MRLAILFSLTLASLSAFGRDRDSSPQKEGVWYLDYAAAKRESFEQSRPLLMVFTDSLGGGASAKLEREVLERPAFLNWANHQAVLLKIDHPRALFREPELKRQNERLRLMFARYKPDPAPVVLVLNPIGGVVGDAPFEWKEGADEDSFLADLKNFIERKSSEAGDPPEEEEEEP